VQQFADASDGVVGDARQHLVQIGFRIQAVEFRRTDQVVNCCCRSSIMFLEISALNPRRSSNSWMVIRAGFISWYSPLNVQRFLVDMFKKVPRKALR